MNKRLETEFLEGDIRRFKDNKEAFAIYFKGKWINYAYQDKLIFNIQTGEIKFPEDGLVNEDQLEMIKSREDEIDFCNLIKKEDEENDNQ